jgi:hypothetical protein
MPLTASYEQRTQSNVKLKIMVSIQIPCRPGTTTIELFFINEKAP